MSKEEIKNELTKYEPTPEERTVIRGAVFNVISLATAGAGSLGLSGYLWNKSRPKPTGIPTILGFFTGLALGGALGMEKGMRTLRTNLPMDSKLLAIIRETDQLREHPPLPPQLDPQQQQPKPAASGDEQFLSDEAVKAEEQKMFQQHEQSSSSQQR
ncbi:hypothetical protein O0I10_012163 [Lichtheimia ornata]|uniref:Uncharacterized protein n=1 Tax=Lichtheimia ornata TaxID=688661 RepID=A0AAD7UT82_9FUNG|nr:uncharacterized protein O0I10_012163 [Lichtheimia ornata]KAJ8652202.1 hypothetical protein O0I10_012163 [Lichtheimia ornata]